MILHRKIFPYLLILGTIFTATGFVSPEDWYQFESSNPKFIIEFPEKPVNSSRLMVTKNGNLDVKVISYNASEDETSDNLMYSLNYSELPAYMIDAGEEEKAEYYSKLINSMVYNVHGQLLSEQIINLNDYTGREIKIDFKNGLAVIRIRIYMVGNKLFLLQVITYSKKDFNTSIFRFFNSFEAG